MNGTALVVATAAVLALAACAPSRAPSTPISEASQRHLKVTPLFAVVGQTVEVDYESWGGSGCYRQSETSTRLRGHAYTHEYETWSAGSPGGPCKTVMVRGGARARLEQANAGTYEGTVVMNDVSVAAYTLRVFDSAVDAERRVLALLPDLSRWERLQLLRQAAAFPPGELRDELNAVGASIVRDGVDTPELEAVVAWLDSPAGAPLVPELGPLLGGMSSARKRATHPSP